MRSRWLLLALLFVAGLLGPAGTSLAQNDIMKVIRGNYERQQKDWFQSNFGFGGPSRQDARPPATPAGEEGEGAHFALRGASPGQ